MNGIRRLQLLAFGIGLYVVSVAIDPTRNPESNIDSPLQVRRDLTAAETTCNRFAIELAQRAVEGNHYVAEYLSLTAAQKAELSRLFANELSEWTLELSELKNDAEVLAADLEFDGNFDTAAAVKKGIKEDVAQYLIKSLEVINQALEDDQQRRLRGASIQLYLRNQSHKLTEFDRLELLLHFADVSAKDKEVISAEVTSGKERYISAIARERQESVKDIVHQLPSRRRREFAATFGEKIYDYTIELLTSQDRMP